MRTINFTSLHKAPWERQFPDSITQWGDWKFLINADDQPYDYLVVMDDLERAIKPNCPLENIIHVTTEPPSVYEYHRKFTDQFAWLITHQEHPYRDGIITGPPYICWFVGWALGTPHSKTAMPYHEVAELFHHPKTKMMSIISSNKTFTKDHRKRLEFAKKLKEHYGAELDFYGRGFTNMEDKLESLQDYRFQIVIENSSRNDYFTEKITDSFLAGTYPIYHGCKNIDKYFPKNSYLQFDMDDFEGSIALIDDAISQNIDKKYKVELAQAQELCLTKHNVFPALVSTIADIEAGKYGKPFACELHAGKLLPFRSRKFKNLRVKKKLSAKAMFYLENLLRPAKD